MMKRIFFWAAWMLLIVLFFALDNNNNERFDDISKRYKESAVNLDRDIDAGLLARIIDNNGYAPNKADASFIAGFMAGKLTDDAAPEVPEALTDLRMRKWQVPAQLIDSVGPPSFRKRLEELRSSTGWSDEVEAMYRSAEVTDVAGTGLGSEGVMTVKVYDPRPDDEVSLWDKFLHRTRVPSPGVIVRLQTYRYVENDITAIPVAYARTNDEGVAVFRGLQPDSSYSVLPIARDLSYGSEKGTYLGTWREHEKEDRTTYEFVSSPLKVRLFQDAKLQNMREDGIVTVRTPEMFRNTSTNYMIVFLVGWVVLFFIGNTRGRRMDNLLAAGIMLACGLSMLLMLGINDPLTAKVMGYEMAQGSIAGVITVIALMCLDIRKFVQNRYWVKFDILMWLAGGVAAVLDFFGMRRIRGAVAKAWRSSPGRAAWSDCISSVCNRMLRVPAVGYLVLAFLLSATLWLFGSEVGGMKVNLILFGLPVQPSEIIKFLFVAFMAAFFFEKGDSIVAYSEPRRDWTDAGMWTKLKRRAMVMATMLAGLGGLMLLYMVNGDMGPALVVALTFIVLYSLVKSRVAFGQTSDREQMTQLVRSDISMLIVGVLSFMAMMGIGQQVAGQVGMKLFLVLWLLGWWAWGRADGGRFYETPVMFNVIVAFFIFGPDFFMSIGFDSIAERLHERNSMCLNTWGTLGGEPGINTQIAEGMWALATGGFTGQGLGNATAHYIPAFHTDMILQSIGEVMGFLGIAGVIVLLSVVLYRSVLAGYRSGHPMLLYLCFGIAVVTGIQLFIIALGSLGVIPLTGISVPFFSFGRVSLLLNIFAFGVVLSVSARGKQVIPEHVRQYNLTVGVLSLAYSALALFVLGVVARYQVGPERDCTLVRPAFVYDTSGAAVVRYNPRITYLTSKMLAGNIYDRNGLLLATSEPDSIRSEISNQYARLQSLAKDDLDRLADKVQKRYYPLGEQTFFMVGDVGNGYYFSSVDNEPYGYLAEARHMSHMRGYDNVMRDRYGKPMTADLVSHRYRRHRFMPDTLGTWPDVQLRDYRALIPFLKEGHHSSLLADYNSGKAVTVIISDPDGNETDSIISIRPNDISLTIDAKLQVMLQDSIPDAINNLNHDKKFSRYERHSIVVLDAINGDLLASANYPLPDYEVIGETIKERVNYYNDNNRPKDWSAYTERDLGLTYMTKPGSTGKVMSSLAGLMHMDKTGYDMTKKGQPHYTVYRDERIHTSRGPEPPAEKESEEVYLKTAIVESSNCYFINLVNDLDLYDELAQVYGRAGQRVGIKDNDKAKFAVPYRLHSKDDIPSDFISAVTRPAQKATRAYDNYIEQRDKKGGKILRMVGEGSMVAEEWMWAWGEGSLDASPASMARVAATAATGVMPRPRYLTTDDVIRDTLVRDMANLNHLRKAMKEETRTKTPYAMNDSCIGGKTGTPERVFYNDSIRKIQQSERDNEPNPRKKKEIPMYHKKNDGWYIAFIDNTNTPGADEKSGHEKDAADGQAADGKKSKGTGKIAVAIRIERTMKSGSVYAKGIMKNVVVPTLKELEYIK